MNLLVVCLGALTTSTFRQRPVQCGGGGMLSLLVSTFSGGVFFFCFNKEGHYEIDKKVENAQNYFFTQNKFKLC